MKCLVLDAMGVIFDSADDVAELLIPFVAEHGGSRDPELIHAAYHEASLGLIDPADFWTGVGIDENLEDEYLACFTLSPGLPELLALARDRSLPVWCLSNDVGRWSGKLRRRNGIEGLLAGSVISGNVGVRKPDTEIYRVLLRQSGYEAADLMFIDDREKNRQAARSLGIDSPVFDADSGFAALVQRLDSGDWS